MAWYRAGTITLTTGSATVVGAGTAWVKYARAGDLLSLPGQALEVKSINSDTQLELALPYSGAGGAGIGYALVPTQGYVPDALAAMQQILNEFGDIWQAWQAGDLQGRGLVLKGSEDAVEDLPTEGNTAGDGYIVAGSKLYVWNGTEWKYAGELVTTPELQQLRQDALDAASSASTSMEGAAAERIATETIRQVVEGARDDAALYAQAAQSGAGVQESFPIGVGLSGDTSGPASFFQVKKGGLGSDGVTPLPRQSMFQRTGPTTANFLYSLLPAGEFDASFQVLNTLLSRYLLTIADPATENTIFGIDKTGMPDSLPMRALRASVDANTAALAPFAVEPGALTDSLLVLRDPLTGNEIAKILKTGEFDSIPSRALKTRINAIASAVAELRRGEFIEDYELELAIAYGQSLSSGISSGQAAISTTQPYGSLMLSGGIRTFGRAPYTGETLVPMVEAVTTGTAAGVETPLSGMAEMCNALIETENEVKWTDHAWHLVGAACGGDGVNITNLGNTAGSNYQGLLSVVDRVKAIADADGRPMVARHVNWIHGPADTAGGMAREEYASRLTTLHANLDADIRARTGRTEPVLMAISQTASHSVYSKPPLVALAQADVCDGVTRFLITPEYFFNYRDQVHLYPESYKWFGAYFGLWRKRVLIDGKPWKWLKPVRKISQGRAVVVIFDVPVRPLVLDTSMVTNPGNYGFSLVDSVGTAIPIASVELAGPTRVKIVAGADLPAGFKVRYAYDNGTNAGAGPLTGARGNLRDGMGYLYSTLIQGVRRPLHSWCEIFEI
ncbi:hypothetical protein DFR41_104243 [Pseudacidovorax intermedius]|uniref:Sialate O-acetylesterase domain-containing protein n=1 Tax=Pseudacidovorax intermedius TaxID=433924 RepID=A0A370FFI8_9BURK|nr:hypothetical protein [Pseudacidovorax intermedius]RDI25186.1 hypothetical protein DFR41_104243 [Pseudacidovorax intermedius]